MANIIAVARAGYAVALDPFHERFAGVGQPLRVIYGMACDSKVLSSIALYAIVTGSLAMSNKICTSHYAFLCKESEADDARKECLSTSTGLGGGADFIL